LILQGKIYIVILGEVGRVVLDRYTLQWIILKSPALMAGGYHSFFRANIGRIIDFTGMGTVGTAFFNYFSEQHFPHLKDDYSVFLIGFLPHFSEIDGKIVQRNAANKLTATESMDGHI